MRPYNALDKVCSSVSRIEWHVLTKRELERAKMRGQGKRSMKIAAMWPPPRGIGTKNGKYASQCLRRSANALLTATLSPVHKRHIDVELSVSHIYTCI